MEKHLKHEKEKLDDTNMLMEDVCLLFVKLGRDTNVSGLCNSSLFE